jgi:hypothetical protein
MRKIRSCFFTGRVVHVVPAGLFQQLGHRHFLQLGEVDLAVFQFFIIVMGACVDPGIHLLGDFLRQGERLLVFGKNVALAIAVGPCRGRTLGGTAPAGSIVARRAAMVGTFAGRARHDAPSS